MSRLRVLPIDRNVRLTKLVEQHAAKTYRWVCNEEISRNIGLKRTPSLAYTHDWIRRANQDSKTWPFAILANECHVGNVVLDCQDDFLQTARFSIYIGQPDARGRGIGSSATYLALAEAFDRIELHKVWLRVHEKNFRALRLYKKLGFVQEGILREEFWLEGQRVSAIYMGILRSEFDAIRVKDRRVPGVGGVLGWVWHCLLGKRSIPARLQQCLPAFRSLTLSGKQCFSAPAGRIGCSASSATPPKTAATTKPSRSGCA